MGVHKQNPRKTKRKSILYRLSYDRYIALRDYADKNALSVTYVIDKALDNYIGSETE